MKKRAAFFAPHGWFLIVLTMAVFDLPAAERLAGIFADNMVLQRDQPVPVWGWAEKGQLVKVRFSGQEKSATAGEDGRWMVRLDPMPANKEPQPLQVSGATSQTVNNVLVGDVWVCSGQSNMAWTLQESTNGKAEIASASLPNLRFIRLSQTISPFPLEDTDARLNWEICAPLRENMYITAVGYFFARELMKEVDVPIGLVGASLGATCIETWIPLSGFRGEPALNESVEQQYRQLLTQLKNWIPAAESSMNSGEILPDFPFDLMATADFQQPAKCFNGMINPIIPFGIRGVIWYQGESNGHEGDIYRLKMKALIGSWRAMWNQGGRAKAREHDFPFYFVQLANFRQSDPNDPAGGDSWTRLREAQFKSLEIPNTGMAVTIDIGEADNVHPANKQDVGRRLALWALAKDYGKNVVYSGPLYKSHTVEGGKVRIAFDHVGTGLCVGVKNESSAEPPSGTLKHFAIAGEDRKWRWADATIDGDTIVVSHPEVPNPVAVRYAFAMNPEGANLYNKDGLPASPFRTDDWP